MSVLLYDAIETHPRLKESRANKGRRRRMFFTSGTFVFFSFLFRRQLIVFAIQVLLNKNRTDRPLGGAH